VSRTAPAEGFFGRDFANHSKQLSQGGKGRWALRGGMTATILIMLVAIAITTSVLGTAEDVGTEPS